MYLLTFLAFLTFVFLVIVDFRSCVPHPLVSAVEVSTASKEVGSGDSVVELSSVDDDDDDDCADDPDDFDEQSSSQMVAVLRRGFRTGAVDRIGHGFGRK